MNQGKNNKQTKPLKIKSLEPQPKRQKSKSLPVYGSIYVGKKKVTVPYVDQIEDIVSSETDKQPIRPHKKVKRGTQFIADILRNSGIDSLVDIGDAMIHKF